MRRRILLVDDEEMLLRALQRSLRDEPFDVFTCAKPDAAGDMISELRIDVVVSDYAMPGRDGISVLRDARVRRPSIATLLMSAVPERAAIQEACLAGVVQQVIEKPWRIHDLKLILRALGSTERKEDRGTVFVVDDDHDIRTAIRLWLENEGYSVECFKDGMDALTRLQVSSLPAFILLDLMMPVLDGYSFLQRRDLEPRLRGVPIIVITASGNVTIPDGAVHAVVKKPMDLHVLESTIAAIAPRHPAASDEVRAFHGN